MTLIEHSGLCPADLETSLRFYVDGIGLSVIFDVTLAADIEGLIGVRTEHVRTVFLGDPEQSEAGMLELIDLGNGTAIDQPPATGLPTRGLFLLSFVTPVDAALARLADLGMGGPPRRVPTGRDTFAATVVDPDGVMVELLDKPFSPG